MFSLTTNVTFRMETSNRKTYFFTAKTDYANKFLTFMERLRRDVLKKRGTFGADYQTMNETQLLNVMITSNFNFIHLVGLRLKM